MEEKHPSTVSGPITDAERTYAIELLIATRDSLRQTLAGLSTAQQQYKPAPDRWSIAECTEHIALVDRGIFMSLQKGMAVPADDSKRTDVKLSDVFVIKAVRSRGTATPAPLAFVPTGRYGDVESALAIFEEQRAAEIAYVRAATEDFRTHYFDHPFLGTLDAFQAVLLLASHGERHRKQIEEVKTDPGFPN
ncbi:DinB family protein [Fibrella forsythiae]|uniref:DinB family protein n=1 Tax=Fibrella forsythiae TaxID=2817061 RepID=A0ABS3JCN9_9BACT|nr:DinB family protein [Fibrella forsythiae]MBO0947766.1 DinB family protein [Fibrella forsythiae]